MIHPYTKVEFINEEIGNGLVATKFIPKGTITWVMDPLDRIFSPEEFNRIPPSFQEILETYTFRNNCGQRVLCWDNGKFVNHSFKSNCLTTAYDFEIAVRDINPGEQLTDDYGYLNITAPFKGSDEGTKRKYVYPDDLLKYHPVWDKSIQNVFSRIIENDQPLWNYLPDTTKDVIKKIIAGNEELKSIKYNYFDPNDMKKI
ncbi:MAG: SET domain-containing protein [Saprospiraceae bacterium]|nr:SET domain-containing protein [Saprospiraceae bacterium]